MDDKNELFPSEKKGTLFFRLSAADCLTQRIEKLLGQGEYVIPTVNLTPNKFKSFGTLESNKFVPFWHNDETFAQFTQREAGIDKQSQNVIEEAAQKVFIESKIPLSKQDKKKLTILATLFTSNEIDALQGYAISVENEMGYELKVGLEASGILKQGTVQKIISPILQYREEADMEIIDFNEAVITASDGVYGSPYFFPDPETSPEVVTEIKERKVLPQEPNMIHIMSQIGTVWGSAVQGESVSNSSTNPIRDIGGNNNLVVLDTSKNEQLTTMLFEKPKLLRYLLATQIIKSQLKRMDDLKYKFKIVRERMMCEDKGEIWPFEKPAKQVRRSF